VICLAAALLAGNALFGLGAALRLIRSMLPNPKPWPDPQAGVIVVTAPRPEPQAKPNAKPSASSAKTRSLRPNRLISTVSKPKAWTTWTPTN